MPVLARSFFARATEVVARELLGCRLVRRFADGSRLVGRVVETEAYPPGDPASHAFRGPTPRCLPMFGRPGTIYVYRIYGVHWCLNLVTEVEGTPAAVLLRGLDGIARCNGPARLCQTLGIDGRFDGGDLLVRGGALGLLDGASPSEPVVTTTRVGLSRAAELPLRYYLRGSAGVSRPDRAGERRQDDAIIGP